MAECRYWLAERNGPLAVTLVDGCHDSPEGVAKAAKLHRRIFNSQTEWVMVEFHDLPDLDPAISEEAAADCAYLVAEGVPRASGWDSSQEEQ